MKLIYITFLVFVTCQTLKLFYFAIKDKRLKLNLFLTDGGMPSAHSAVSSAITSLAYQDAGKDSVVFAVSFVFTMIVLNDSIKVRRDVGLQAIAINKMMETIEEIQDPSEDDHESIKKINERNGHKIREVIVGITLGISLSTFFYNLFF